MKKWIGIVLLIFALASITPVRAEEGWKNVTAPEVKDMLEGGRALAIHVLSRIEYEMQHIRDSINIPITEMHATGKLPREKDKPLIFYCMGHR